MFSLFKKGMTNFLFTKKPTRFSRKWNREREIQKMKSGGTLK